MVSKMKQIHEPIFIICTGRSGSTLLRYILGAHNMIDAPQELHLGVMIKEMTRITGLLHEDRISQDTDLREVIKSEVKSQIDSMMRSALKREIWCDKSISSIDHLDEIMYVFPKARYIFLYRDCLDFVNSALEVSKYGFNGFWFEDYVLKNPINIVDGLVNFWCLQTEKRIALQEGSQYNIYPIKYEDIVHDTESTTQALFKFLNLSFDPKILENLFAEFRPGKGDLKVQSSNSIINNTGKGRYVPLKHIDEKSFQRMNKVLKQLGYKEIDRNYNFSIKGISISDDLLAYSVKRVYDYLFSCLENKPIPPELKNKKLSFNIPGMEESPLLMDIQKGRIEKNHIGREKEELAFKINIDTMLKLMDGKLNISWSHRQGLIDTNVTYQQLNEVGKYLFG